MKVRVLSPAHFHSKYMNNIISFQILGFSGGIPTKDRITSCTVISTDNGNSMIDCGEGAYRKYIQNGYDLGMLNNIFITHMHPDHISGLVPILFYKNVSNDLSDITIVGPENVKSFIDFALKELGVKLKYKCIFQNALYLPLLFSTYFLNTSIKWRRRGASQNAQFL